MQTIELDFAGSLRALPAFRRKYPALTIAVKQEVGPGGGNVLLSVTGQTGDLVALLTGADYAFTAEEVGELFGIQR